jgi:hypothetical protein
MLNITIMLPSSYSCKIDAVAAGMQAEAAASELQPKEEQLAEMHETLDAQVRLTCAATAVERSDMYNGC